jgi:hypothetical protein
MGLRQALDLARLEADESPLGPGSTWQLTADERIGGKPPRRPLAWPMRAIAALLAIVAVLVLLDDRVRPSVMSVADIARSPTFGLSRQQAPPADAAPVSQQSDAAPEPQRGQEAALMLPEAGADEPATLAEPEEAAEPLPPPTIDKDDPFQVRALAVGLHPGLSRALLEKLTPEDFRNAAVAVRTALAETKLGDTHVWPVKPAAAQAQFTVSFTKGAAPGCRRYIVVVSKDRWATTALPMEKCAGKGTLPGSPG